MGGFSLRVEAVMPPDSGPQDEHCSFAFLSSFVPAATYSTNCCSQKSIKFQPGENQHRAQSCLHSFGRLCPQKKMCREKRAADAPPLFFFIKGKIASFLCSELDCSELVKKIQLLNIQQQKIENEKQKLRDCFFLLNNTQDRRDWVLRLKR